jgi:Kdo2-lipid IVA lauroyltransferase/acyltransferase
MKQKITLFFTKGGIQLFRWIPFFVLFRLADFLCFVFQYLIRYRKKVIHANLQRCFPEKTVAELKQIERGAYQNLCDITLESIKGLTMNEQTIRERYSIKNPEILAAAFAQKKSIIIAGAHYGNWEWGVRSWSLWFRHQVIGIYKPLANKTIEAYLNQRREDFGMKLAAPKQTREAIALSKTTPCIYVLFGDQNPHNLNTCHWVNFLKQDTAWLQGVGEIANQYDFPIYYIRTTRIKRGFYENELIPLCLTPTTYTPLQISQQYAKQVEENINVAPNDWLWSHKRWKHKR